MGKFIGAIIAAVFTALMAALSIMFALIAGSLFGALGGFLVDHPWIFDGEVARTLTVYGLPYAPLWKIGATLGFLSTALPKLVSVKQTTS